MLSGDSGPGTATTQYHCTIGSINSFATFFRSDTQYHQCNFSESVTARIMKSIPTKLGLNGFYTLKSILTNLNLSEKSKGNMQEQLQG
jgi:hypothetical protein